MATLDRIYSQRLAKVKTHPPGASAVRASGSVRKADTVAERAIRAAEASSQSATVVDLKPSWISIREDRYIVTLDQLSSFSCEGKSLDVLISEVKHPALKTALVTLKRVKSKTFGSEAVRTFHYGNFIAALRSAIGEVKDSSPFDFKVATELCSAMFTVDIKDTSFGAGFIDDLLGDYHPTTVQDLDATRLELSLRAGLSGKTVNHKVTDLRRKLSASNPLSTWDPASYSTRSKIADVRIGDREVTFIRTACPVVGSNRAPEVDPLFIGMLRDMKAQGKQYLYINNQSADPTSDPRPGESSCESNRVAALKALSESEEFKDTFHVVSFAHDSTFYKAAVEAKAHDLKAEFFRHLAKGEQGYFLPDSFKAKPENLVRVHEIINEVHALYFDGKTDLSAEERQEFSSRSLCSNFRIYYYRNADKCSKYYM